VTGWADLERDLLILACAVSAGVHAALAPAHLEQGAPAGLPFGAAAALLAGLAVVLTRDPSTGTAAAAAVAFAGMLAAYGLAVTSGLPLVHADPEPVTGLGLFTKAVEACGLVAAVRLIRPRGALA
jgi:hypothetical protein